MKATLEFNLPEDQAEHKLALHGSEWMIVAHTLAESIRSKLKYAEHSEETVKVLEGIRAELFEEIRDRGLSFE